MTGKNVLWNVEMYKDDAKAEVLFPCIFSIVSEFYR